MPKVLISDELSDAAVQIFRDRGVEVDFQPQLGKDKAQAGRDHRRLRRPRHPLGHQGDRGPDREGGQPARHRARRDRGRQRRHPGGERQGHRGDEHALRQLDHHRRARHRDDVRAARGRSRRPTPRPGRASGRSRSSWGSRSPARRWGSSAAATSARWSRPRAIGLKMKVIAYDPFLSAERAQALGVERIEDLDELLARADFVTLHLPEDREDREHPLGGADRADEAGGAADQLRPRRAGGRGGGGRGAEVGASGGGGVRRLLGGAGEGERALRRRRTWSAPRTSGPRPRRRRRTSRCKWLSRCRITWCRGRSRMR